MKWTIGKKLGGICLFMISILIIFGTISYRNISKSIENSELVRHTFMVIDANGEIPTHLWETASTLRSLFLTGDQTYYQQYQSARSDLLKSLNETKKMVRNEKAARLIATLENLISERLKSFDESLLAYQQKQMPGAISYLKKGLPLKLTKDIISVHSELDNLERSLLSEHEKELEASNADLKNLILIGIPLTIIFISVIAFILIRSITVPLQGLTRFAEMISHGDLSLKITDGGRDDEIGRLSSSFASMGEYLQRMSLVAQSIAENDLTVSCTPNSDQDKLGTAFSAMIANLRTMANEIQEASGLINSSAAQIATMTSQLAASSAETAASVNETSTTVEEIKITAQLVNNKSSFVSDSARETAQMTLMGRKSISETMNGMDKIRRQMDFIAESVVKLSEQSMAIGEIISSVNDLAGQSNILAVNASIEAAKAEEHGKGFVVVAQEMRSLADQSKQATEQVRRILNDIQKAISSAIMATEQGGKTVESGVRQTTETEGAIQTIEQGASGTVLAATQILASSNEQMVGLNQVAQAMDNIRNASDQIVQSTRQAEQATSSLNDMGKRLCHLVERFKVS